MSVGGVRYGFNHSFPDQRKQTSRAGFGVFLRQAEENSGIRGHEGGAGRGAAFLKQEEASAEENALWANEMTEVTYTDEGAVWRRKREELPSASDWARGNSISEQAARVGVAPYDRFAKGGVVEYNGVVFICDTLINALCLGDMSDPKKVLVVPLEEGGTLRVNRDCLGDLSLAMDMFSAADVRRIMEAIALDKRAQSALHELEEDKSGIGDSAEAHLDGVSESAEAEKTEKEKEF